MSSGRSPSEATPLQLTARGISPRYAALLYPGDEPVAVGTKLLALGGRINVPAQAKGLLGQDHRGPPAAAPRRNEAPMEGSAPPDSPAVVAVRWTTGGASSGSTTGRSAVPCRPRQCLAPRGRGATGPPAARIQRQAGAAAARSAPGNESQNGFSRSAAAPPRPGRAGEPQCSWPATGEPRPMLPKLWVTEHS